MDIIFHAQDLSSIIHIFFRWLGLFLFMIYIFMLNIFSSNTDIREKSVMINDQV